jgi:hypothetical protein
MRKEAIRAPIFMCAHCEVQGVGDHRALCACGVTVQAGRNRGTHPFRCVRIESRTVHNPARIGIAFGDRELLPEGQAARAPRPVKLVDQA